MALHPEAPDPVAFYLDALAQAQAQMGASRVERDRLVRDALRDGLSMRDVAGALGVTPAAVHRIAHATTV
jgi:transposase-like protein